METYGVWYSDGSGPRYTDADGKQTFTYEIACEIAIKIGGGVRNIDAMRIIENRAKLSALASKYL